MKKIIFGLALISSIFFAGCYDPVIASIRREVELENSVVNGSINSIVRYTDELGDFIFLQNGGILFKEADNNNHGSWRNAPEPSPINYDIYSDSFSGTQIINLVVSHDDATDTDTLFALGVNYKTDTGSTTPSEKVLFKYSNGKDGAQWEEIFRRNMNMPTNSNMTYFDDNFTVFCTNSPNPKNRRAYARIGVGDDQKVYELKASSDWSNGNPTDEIKVEPSVSDDEEKSAETFPNVSSVILFGKAGEKRPYFFNYPCATNETKDSEPTYAYWVRGATLFWCSIDDMAELSQEGGSSGRKYKVLVPKGRSPASSTIFSIAVNIDSIIVGTGNNVGTTASGAQRIKIENTGTDSSPIYAGKPIGEITASFDTNAAEQLRSPYSVTSMLSMDPGLQEIKNTLYAALLLRGTETNSSGSINNVGLWSYYPERHNWNRE